MISTSSHVHKVAMSSPAIDNASRVPHHSQTIRDIPHHEACGPYAHIPTDTDTRRYRALRPEIAAVTHLNMSAKIDVRHQ